jgi:hypothetical protein
MILCEISMDECPQWLGQARPGKKTKERPTLAL